MGPSVPLKETTTPLGTDSLMLAVKSHLEPARLGDLDATFLVDVGGDVFTLRVSGGELAIRRGSRIGRTRRCGPTPPSSRPW
ncbi:hypothetical protein GCM10027612_25160 [Microbispora bryophytorum subsp. camponoti]